MNASRSSSGAKDSHCRLWANRTADLALKPFETLLNPTIRNQDFFVEPCSFGSSPVEGKKEFTVSRRGWDGVYRGIFNFNIPRTATGQNLLELAAKRIEEFLDEEEAARLAEEEETLYGDPYVIILRPGSVDKDFDAQAWKLQDA